MNISFPSFGGGSDQTIVTKTRFSFTYIVRQLIISLYTYDMELMRHRSTGNAYTFEENGSFLIIVQLEKQLNCAFKKWQGLFKNYIQP